MKYLILSDTHGALDSFKHLSSHIEKVDAIIHLGDFVKDVEPLRSTSKKIYAVKGNCDLYSDYPEECVIVDGKFKLFLTHGHRYGVKSDLTKLLYKCLELEANIALFGHTHMPLKIEEQGIVFHNPGSLSLPKHGSTACFSILEIKEDTCDICFYTLP